MIFSNIFAYIELALTVAGAVQACLQLKISSTNPLSAIQLESIAAPVIASLQVVVPSVNIPTALVDDIANAIADAVNTYYKPAA